jgi:4-coumarate--CoA ligase
MTSDSVVPSKAASELGYQLKTVAAHYPLKGLVAHPASLEEALEAAKEASLPESRIMLITRDLDGSHPRSAEFPVIEELIPKDLGIPVRAPRKLTPGEAKQKLAFLSFSSGSVALLVPARVHY